MNIDLYTAATPNGYKVSIMLEELGLTYNVHKINLAKGEQREKWFLNMNPNGRIPVLKFDKEVIFDSGAILYFLANKLSKFLVGGNINDLTSGFRIYSQESLNAIPYNDITSDGYSFQIEMTSLFINTSLNYIETPITFEERRQGQSKMNFGIILEAALKIFSIFLKRIFK